MPTTCSKSQTSQKLLRIATSLPTLAAFLLFAIALWLPSGPSYAATLIMIGSLVFIPFGRTHIVSKKTFFLAILLVAMGLLWCFLTPNKGISRYDLFIKWLIAALCLFYVNAYPPRFKAIAYGLPIGCIGMASLALWQVYFLNISRATGYTNAIPWGNTALLLSCFSAVFLIIFWHSVKWCKRTIYLVAIAAGMTASILSESRGGWIALFFIGPAILIVIWQHYRHVFFRLTLDLLFFTLLLFNIFYFLPNTNTRIHEAITETVEFKTQNKANTSLGIRLEQYRFGLALIKQKPLFGWGHEGMVKEVLKNVEKTEVDPSLLGHQDYIHNEIIDNWVKTGIIGPIILISFYLFIIYIFWPTKKRMEKYLKQSEIAKKTFALRIIGILIPIMYFSFGLSMQLFAHNTGLVFFLFCLIIVWSCLNGLEKNNESNICIS